jgi:hypothetical protein
MRSYPSQTKPLRRGGATMELFAILAFVLLWFVLQAWVLPRFGVST